MSPTDDQYGSELDWTLPFTGADLTGLIVVALFILVLGLLLWRSTRRP